MFISRVLLIKISILITTTLLAKELSLAKKSKMLKIGKNVYTLLCDKSKLDDLNISDNKENLKESIINNSICHNIDKKELDYLIFFLQNKNSNHQIKKLDNIDKTKKCPVCGMYPYKYKAWVSIIEIDNNKIYFDGVKDMMKYYLYTKKYIYNRDNIKNMYVQDFYNLELINAKDAWYVIGSNVRGPMGNELIPFKTKKDAQTFFDDHKGEKIITFQEITTDTLITRRVKR